MLRRQSETANPDDPKSPSTIELQPINTKSSTGASSTSTKHPKLPRNSHLHPTPYDPQNQPEIQRPEDPTNHTVENQSEGESEDQLDNRKKEDEEDSVRGYYRIITTASIVGAAFVIALFILSFMVVVHLIDSKKALDRITGGVEVVTVTEVVIETQTGYMTITETETEVRRLTKMVVTTVYA